MLLLGALCSQELVPLGCIVYPEVGGAAKSSSCEASGKVWEPPIELWVCAPKIIVKAPDSALKDYDNGR